MSSVAFLVSELQSLSSETRRKHPEIREAAEKSLAILRSSPEQARNILLTDGQHSQDLLRPVFMGCATRNSKVVSISLGSLQRLIALQAVPNSVVPSIIKIMNGCISQGVDVQLRVLQILLGLITNFPSVHGALLGDALLVCFKLQESRIAVVSSTAAATLRQLVMFLVDKVADEDKKEASDPKSKTTLPDGSVMDLAPSATDAFLVFQDLCLLCNSEKPQFLNLETLPRTFALELIESVLTNYHELFRKHVEMLELLRHLLCPLLLKTLSEKPIFPLTLRSTRVVFLLLKQFSAELITETEVFLTMLIKIVGGDIDTGTGSISSEHASHSQRPHWMRVLAMEVVRGLCNDSELMRSVWSHFDAQDQHSKLFTSLLTVLQRLITEKPALLGVSSEMFGVGVSSSIADSTSSNSSTSGGHGFDMGSVAGLVANAASATVSGVVGMMSVEAGLNSVSSSMKVQCIDQLDKADSPPIPDSYIYLLGLQSIVSLCDGFAATTLPLFNSIVVQRPRLAGETAVRAPPALDLSSLAPDQASTVQLKAIHGMVESAWPALLAGLSFVVATNLSEELFADVLQSYQNMTNVAGMLGLVTPRDAFLTSLAKFAIPSRVVSSIQSYIEPPTPRTSTMLPENIAHLTSGSTPTQPPGLSERNMACLKILISCALFLAGSLGPSWFSVLEALQNADYVLTSKGSRSTPMKRGASGEAGGSASRSVSSTSISSPNTDTATQSARIPLLQDLDSENLQRAMQRLFDSSKNLEDSAFTNFVSALCRLSSEMVDMQSDAETLEPRGDAGTIPGSALLSASTEHAHRRRVSGIQLPRTLRTGDFGIGKLERVAKLNVPRLTFRPPDVAWTPVTKHLLAVLHHSSAPYSIRLQAAHALDEVLVVVTKASGSAGSTQSSVLQRIIDVLAQQVIPRHFAINNSTVVDIRKLGLETLNQILQLAIHHLSDGWETIFDMLDSACDVGVLLSPISEDSPVKIENRKKKPPPLGYTSDRNSTALIRIAFQSLTLVCDTVSTLLPNHVRLLIQTIGAFGRQNDTNIALTAAGSMLWGVSDSVQAKRKNTEQEPEYSEIWMFLLLALLELCEDPRPEVRLGAIQTMFRTMQLYGSTLSSATWDACIWKVAFPLIDSIDTTVRQGFNEANGETSTTVKSWEESKVLCLNSISQIFSEFLLSNIIALPSFDHAWDTLVIHVRDSFILDSSAIGSAALRCLEKALKVFEGAPENLKDTGSKICDVAWKACKEMGEAVQKRAKLPPGTAGFAVQPLDQDCLLSLVDVLRAVHLVGRSTASTEWSLDDISCYMGILKSILTFPYSPAYRPDIDNITPLQGAVLDGVTDIDLSVSGSPSLILRDLSEFITLPFLAAFDVEDRTLASPSESKPRASSPTRVTYIGLTKKVMPLALKLFIQFKELLDIYVDETLETLISAFSILIKLKYDCPPPSKFGKDIPLWKTATNCFLQIVKECTSYLRSNSTLLPDARLEAIWRYLIDAFRGGILADCSVTFTMTQEEQKVEERFDLALISTLEIDVIPLLGEPRVPDDVIIQLSSVLQKGSIVYNYDADDRDIQMSSSVTHGKRDSIVVDEGLGSETSVSGSTASGALLPRERFAYWCFGLLFLVCSDTLQEAQESSSRVASLCLPALLARCKTIFSRFLADESLRGQYPFPRAREEELVYSLRKIHDMKLREGTLWAALSESPSANSVQQPPPDFTHSISSLLRDISRRSPRAHLFYFYPELCRISSLPKGSVSAWLNTSSKSINEEPSAKRSVVLTSSEMQNYEELDARSLAASCLKQIGLELGVDR